MLIRKPKCSCKGSFFSDSFFGNGGATKIFFQSELRGKGGDSSLTQARKDQERGWTRSPAEIETEKHTNSPRNLTTRYLLQSEKALFVPATNSTNTHQ